jgi:hypothetical protein
MTEWKLVPVEPDDAMIYAGVYVGGAQEKRYRAMLAAAPEPPPDPRDAEIARLKAENERLREALQAMIDWANGNGDGYPGEQAAKALRGDANE